MKKDFPARIKGGSLIYVVMISLLVAMLVGGGLLLSHFQQPNSL